MNETFKYKLLTALRYLGDSFYYPFIALYLSSRGLIEDKVGLILAISPIIGIICNPIYSKICKNVNITKIVLGIISILEGLIICAISFHTQFVSLTVLVLLLSVFGACHYGMMDSLLTVYCATTDMRFSKIRIFGSIAYVIGTTAGGYVIKFVNYQLCFGIATLLFLITGLLYLLCKPIDIKEEVVEKPTYKELLSHKEFYLYCIVYALLLGSAFASDHFFSLFLKTKGIGEDGYGLVYSYYVIVECITLFVLGKWKKEFKADNIILICGIALFLRQFINFLDLPAPIIVVAAGFRGFFFALFLHTTYSYCEKLLGKRLSIIGIMTMALLQAIVLAILEFTDGIIIKNNGYQMFYLLMMILAFVAIILQVVRIIVNKKKQREDIRI